MWYAEKLDRIYRMNMIKGKIKKYPENPVNHVKKIPKSGIKFWRSYGY